LVRRVEDSPFFSITRQDSRSLDVLINDRPRRALVVVQYGGLTHRVATLDGPGMPWGTFDRGGPLPCGGRSTEVSGWAIDTDGFSRVSIESVIERDGMATWHHVADALMRTDRSSDYYPDSLLVYPDGQRVAWTADVPCPPIGQQIRVRAQAVDRSGIAGELAQTIIVGRGR
jgi:hypothetical protein